MSWGYPSISPSRAGQGTARNTAPLPGPPRRVNAMFAQKQNKLLTKNVRLGLDTHKHRRSLNVLVIGG